MRKLIDDSELSLSYLGWASASILAPAFAMRLLRRFRPAQPPEEASADIFALPGPLNAMMTGIYRGEATLAASTGLPFGLSLAAIAVR